MKYFINERQYSRLITEQEISSLPKKRIGHVSMIELVTKYKNSFMGFFEHLQSSSEDENFCDDPEKAVHSSMELLNDLLIRMAEDNKSTPENVIKDLYNKFDKGLGKVIINIAAPIMKKKMENYEPSVSKEIVDIISEKLRQKYGQNGSLLVSVLNEIFYKLDIKLERFC